MKVPVRKSQLVLESIEYSPLGRIFRAAYLHVTERTGLRAMRKATTHGLVYLLHGSGVYEDERIGTRNLAAGDLITVCPSIRHRYAPGQGQQWDEFYLSFTGPVFQLWQQCGLLDIDRPIVRLLPIDYWLPKMQAIAEKGPQGDSDYVLQQVCALQQFLCETRVAAAHQRDSFNNFERVLVEKASEIFSQDLEVHLAPREVAKSLGISYDTLRRAFKRVLGVSPGRFRAERVLHRAAQMLSEGKLMNKEIAERLGFTDEFHFSKRFHSVMGLSPRSYRRLHQSS